MNATLPPRPEMERATLARDASYDGLFFLAVKTTGIFCRPSCPAKKPKPQNVVFYPTPKEALFAGFRPCKRCRPLEADGRPPEWVAGLLSAIEREPGQRLDDGELRRRGHARPIRQFLYGVLRHTITRLAPMRLIVSFAMRIAVLDLITVEPTPSAIPWHAVYWSRVTR